MLSACHLCGTLRKRHSWIRSTRLRHGGIKRAPTASNTPGASNGPASWSRWPSMAAFWRSPGSITTFPGGWFCRSAAIWSLYGSFGMRWSMDTPAAKAWINELIVYPGLWLWMPFHIYRQSHLQHHRNSSLTDPLSGSILLPRRRSLEWQPAEATPPDSRPTIPSRTPSARSAGGGPATSPQRGGTPPRGDLTHLGAWLCTCCGLIF